MRKFAFIILLLFPLIAFPQAEKRYRSIIIDSIKALSGGIIDAKDNVKFEKAISIGGALDGSAILTVTSTTQGALMPRMNTAARDAISSPTDGLLIFNNQTNQYEFFESTWQAVGGGGDGNGIYDNSNTVTGARIITQNEFDITFDATGGVGKFILKNNINQVLTLDGTGANSAIEYQIGGVAKVTTGFFSVGDRFEIFGGALITGFNTVTGNVAFGAIPNLANTPFRVARSSATQQTSLYDNTSGNNAIMIRSLALSKLDFDNQTDGNPGSIWSDNTNGLRLRTNGVDRLAIGESSGDIGMGMTTTTPGARVNIRGVNAAPTSDAFLVEDNVGTDLFRVENAGDVGIGISDPNSKLHVLESFTSGTTTLEESSILGIVDISGTAIHSGSGLSSINSISGKVNHSSSGAIAEMNATVGKVDVSGTSVGTVTVAHGVVGSVFNSGDGIITTATSLYGAPVFNSGSGSITNAYGLFVEIPIGGDNNFGAFIDGDVGISIANPLARLNVEGENAANTTDALLVEDNVGTDLFIIENAGNIGIGTGTPAASAKLEISTTTGALLFPRMTTAQRDALTAVNGMVVYNSSLDKLQVRAAGVWVSLH